jgi:integrase
VSTEQVDLVTKPSGSSRMSTAAPGDATLYTAAIFTGMRMGELYGLRWAHVDLGRGLITVRRSYDQD